MTFRNGPIPRRSLLLLCCLAIPACGRKPAAPADAPPDPELSRRGTIEVTAKLVDVPEGAIFRRELYNYATILEYKVLQVHRGKVEGETIHVGHYNPFKPRTEAADSRVTEVGGNLKTFRPGQIHRMALEVPIDDHYMGGIVNKYFGKETGPIYWAVWTNLVGD